MPDPRSVAVGGTSEMTIAVMMGVSGSGKTTIARGVAEREGWRLLEGDVFHPPSNVAKMHAGMPLTDEDRWPWLRAIAHEIDAMRARGEQGVVACSALKRSYRDILIGDRTDVVLVYLQGSKALIAERIASRKGHFMPATLLDSQFATLEEPGPDEHPIVVPIGASPDAIVDAVVDRLRERTA
jgi:gluconokinase